MKEGASPTKGMQSVPCRGHGKCQMGDRRKSRVLRGEKEAAVSQEAKKVAT